jgi:hypothetical protein
VKKITFLLISILPAYAWSQTEIDYEVNYTENTQLVNSFYGISFNVPRGWFGKVPDGGTALILAEKTDQMNIMIMFNEFDPDKLLTEMQQEMTFQGITFVPAGNIRRDGMRWYGDYKVSGLQQEAKAQADVRVGRYNTGIISILISPTATFEAGKKDLAALLSSVVFTPPEKPQYAAAAGITQPWNEYLKGRSLKYFYTQGQFSDTDFIDLCGNGTFVRYNEAISGGYTGSGFVAGGEVGKWTATGQGDHGILFLTKQDGVKLEFSIEYTNGSKGTGLYLAGKRYYIEISKQCN